MNYFWGPIDSLVDWCESNYTVSPYIAEFFNSISSLPIMFLGFFGMFWTRKLQYENRFLTSFACLAVVGLGSFMFHCTLRYHYQLLDELPMLACNKCFIYILKELNEEKRQTTILIGILLFLFGTCVYSYVVLKLYSVFLIAHGIGLSYLWWLMIPLFRTVRQSSWKMYKLSLYFYGTGLLIWTIENLYCRFVQDFYLHAMWHCLAGYGTYSFIVFLIIERSFILKHKPILKTVGLMHFVSNTNL